MFEANDRCNQENLLAQLHGGVRALSAPMNTLESNGAWMVMTALAWNLKAWWALMLPVSPGRWQAQHREEKHRVLRTGPANHVWSIGRHTSVPGGSDNVTSPRRERGNVENGMKESAGSLS